MSLTIRLHKSTGAIEIEAAAGQNLLGVLRSAGAGIDSPCNGNGTCGKCRVRVDGIQSAPSEREKELLGDAALSNGYRLACLNKVSSHLDIFPEETETGARIAVEGVKRTFEVEPAIVKKFVRLTPPNLENQIADLQNVSNSMEKDKPSGSIQLIRKLPSLLRENNYGVTLVLEEGRLLEVEAGDTAGTVYGVAVDIGTTTIAAYLYDLNDGSRTEVLSLLNPQRKFGADVISRIEYTMGSEYNLNDMNAEIISCINGMINQFCKKACISINDIYSIVLVGNTTMLHFLMNVTAGNISVSPFIPATVGPHRFKAAELGIGINPEGAAFILPCVSAYVGADTVAAILSSRIYEGKDCALLVDIGTNGEIVVSSGKGLYACSTAAGPAFEGANIRSGMGGVDGAIDSIRLVDGSVEFTVIGGTAPAGICGSGLLDAVAEMLMAGVIDETGRLSSPEALMGEAVKYSRRIIDIGGGTRAFLVVEAERSISGEAIVITQKDIRELQNAKAAIAAGICTLAARAEIKLDDIKKVYLAGGFGSYLNKQSAVGIGLIPCQLADRIESIGNAAGAGASEALLSARMFEKTVMIRDMVEYLELSADPDFTERYIDSMLFPEL